MSLGSTKAFWSTTSTVPVRLCSRTAREDAAVPPSAIICAVCQRLRIRGSHNHAGEVFICAQCQADAKQFIEIQDTLWVESREFAASTDETDEPAHP